MQKKKIIKLQLLLVAGIMGLCLSGCGGSEESEVIVEVKNNPVKIEYGAFDDKKNNLEQAVITEENFSVKLRGEETKAGDISKLEISNIDDFNSELIGTEQEFKLSYDGDDTDTSFKLLIEKAELPQFSIDYSEDIISWDKVDGAKEYEIYINDKKVGSKLNELGITGKKVLEYSLTDYESSVEKCKVKIKAIPEDKIKYEVSESRELTLNKLQPPSNVTYENGRISWSNMVENCEYIVKINGEDYKKTYETFVEYRMVEGENKVEIKAIATEENAISSNTVSCTFCKLHPVTAINYSKGKIVWTDSEQECKYEVKINEEVHETTECSYEYLLEIGKVYTVEVKAVAYGSEYMLSSEPKQQTLQYNRLDKPEISLQQGKTDLDYVLEISNAQENVKYNVEIISYVDNVQNLISYETLSEDKMEFVIGKDITKIIVRANAVDESGKYAESYWDEEELNIAHNKLLTPQVTITKGEYFGSYIISYPAVDGADRYLIEVIVITDVERISKIYDVSVTEREIELREDTKAIEVRVTAYNESGVHDNSDTVVVKQNITWE